MIRLCRCAVWSWNLQLTYGIKAFLHFFILYLKVTDEMFEILLHYIEPLKGKSKEATVKAAEKIMEDLENDETTNGKKDLELNSANQIT